MQNFETLRPRSLKCLLGNIKGSLALLALCAAIPFQANAAIWYTNGTSQPAGGNWNTLSFWGANPDGSGADPSSILNTDDFVVNGGTPGALRTPDTTGTAVFGGQSLTLLADAGETAQLTLKSKIASIGNFVTTGVGSSVVANGGVGTGSDPFNLSLNITNWSLSGATILAQTAASSVRTINLSVGTLTGGSSLTFTGLDGNDFFNMTLTNGLSYTGAMILSDGTLNFNNNLATAGSLTLNTSTVLVLDQNLTFSGLTIGATSLGAGTYTYEYLNTNYDAFFAEGGSGQIMVVPEPATWGLLTLGGMALLMRRRVRASC